MVSRAPRKTGAITFAEPSGTYNYAVGSVSGCVSTGSSGAVHETGATQTIPVTFTPMGISSAGFLGLSGNTGYHVLGGVVAAIAIGIAVVAFLRSRRR